MENEEAERQDEIFARIDLIDQKLDRLLDVLRRFAYVQLGHNYNEKNKKNEYDELQDNLWEIQSFIENQEWEDLYK